MFWLVDIINWTAQPVSPGQEIQSSVHRRDRYRQVFADQETEALALAAERVERERARAPRQSAPCPVEGCEGIIQVRETLLDGTYPCRCHHVQLRLSWATDADGRRKPSLAQEAS